MKRYIVYLLSLSVLTSCSLSVQSKAEKFAEDYIKSCLVYPNSYENVKTVVDTAYYSPAFDTYVLSCAEKIIEAERDIERREYDLGHAKRMMESYSDSNREYGRQQYREYSQKYQELLASDKDSRRIIEEKTACILERRASVPADTVIGWRISSKYRARNAYGMPNLGEYLIVVSPDFSELVFATHDWDMGYEVKLDKLAEIFGYDDVEPLCGKLWAL